MTSIVFATAPTPPAGLRTEPIFVIASVIELGMGLDEPDDDDPPPPVASTKVGLEVTPEFLPNSNFYFCFRWPILSYCFGVGLLVNRL